MALAMSLMPIYSFNFVLLVVFGIFFYRAGLFDGGSGVLWSAISVAVSLLIWQGFGWGLLAMLLGQFGLFVVIGVFRATSKP